MATFISTETEISISLLSKEIPNLAKFIIEYSDPEHRTKTSSRVLNQEQIKEAKNHSNPMVKQALKTIANIQDAINFTDDKLEELAKQRDTVEKTLVSLLSLENQG